MNQERAQALPPDAVAANERAACLCPRLVLMPVLENDDPDISLAPAERVWGQILLAPMAITANFQTCALRLHMGPQGRGVFYNR
jgi:hypothetical protein